MNRKPVLLLDIDNTIADGTRRFKEAGREPSRTESPELHDAWVKAVQSDESLAQDKQIPLMGFLAQRLATHMEVIYLTARAAKHQNVTATWLQKNGFPEGLLLMRKDDDYRETHEIKREAVRLLIAGGAKKVLAIDDDPSGLMSIVYKEEGVVHLKNTFCMWDVETGEKLEAYSEEN